MPLDDETKRAIEEAVAASIAPVVKAAEDAVAAVVKNRDDILAEKKALQRKQNGETEAQRMMRLADNFLASQSTGTGHASPDLTANGKVVIRKGVSTAEYQRLTALAKEKGAEIVYIGDDDPSFAQQRRSGAITAHDFKHEGTRYVSADRVRELGGPIKARRELGDYVTYRNLSDLPEGARAAHDAMEAGDD